MIARAISFVMTASAAVLTAAAEDPWADEVVSYAPVNPMPGFTDPDQALGEPVGGGGFAPDNSSLVTLGAQGGELVLKFNTPVTDDPNNPMGLDFIVYGNAFFVGGDPQRRFQEPGIVEISEDVNNNGIADDPWYLIPGSRAFSPTPFPSVSEPDGEDNDPPFSPSLLAGRIRNPNNNESEFNWGYIDLTPTMPKYLDNYVRPDDPFAVGITPRSGGGDAFDIAWAVDSSGAPAGITQFHFIRLTSFVDRFMLALGACSPDIGAVADVAADLDTDGDGILDEYETRVAGTDPFRPESTVLPLEIPVNEGGSTPGDLLGTAEDALGTRIRLFSAGQRTAIPRNVNVTVDILVAVDSGATVPAGLVKSGTLRSIPMSEADFVAAEIQPAEVTIRYAPAEVTGLDEFSLQPLRLIGAQYVADGVTQVVVNPALNEVTFRTRYPGEFILAAPPGAGDVPLPMSGAAWVVLLLAAAGFGRLSCGRNTS